MKKPFGPCTLAIATAIVASASNLATGVSSPSRNKNPAARRAGRKPRLPMIPVAPSKPGPPNAPNPFCAPWARKTAPSAKRKASNPTSANIRHLPKRNYLEIEILDIEAPGEQIGRDNGSWSVMKQSPSRMDVPLQLWVVLARAFDAVERHSRASIARFELGTTEFGVLEVLYHKGEVPVCDVQRRILVESSSTTYVVDKLVKRGLVRRRHSGSDRRVVLLALTPAGRRLIRRIFPPHAHAMRRAVAALPPSDQARAVRLLRALGLGAAKRLEAKDPV